MMTQVTIDFQTSHLIFPSLIGGMLVLLGLAIAATHWRAVAGAGHYWSAIMRNMDKSRFLGTVVLTIAYFSLMVPVGDLWPNTGLGFLICSIPFIGLTGLLFMHERKTGPVVTLIAVALLAPTFVWWLFGQVFFLTLP